MNIDRPCTIYHISTSFLGQVIYVVCRPQENIARAQHFQVSKTRQLLETEALTAFLTERIPDRQTFIPHSLFSLHYQTFSFGKPQRLIKVHRASDACKKESYKTDSVWDIKISAQELWCFFQYILL